MLNKIIVILILFNYNFSIFELVVAGLFAVSCIIQLMYYLLIFLRVSRWKEKGNDVVIRPVSIIICAKNEEENLKNNLSKVLEQDYPDYEVIVVNDCSEDDSEMVLAEFKVNYKHLRSTSININRKFSHNKKLALTIGIKSAQYDTLLLIDADCVPNSNKWLANMQRNYCDSTEIVIGYGPYKRKKGLLNNFIRYDTLFIGMQYLGFALAGIPYMGVGRNLSYKKNLFYKYKGFSSHAHIDSGDDDLFMNKVAKKHNLAVELSEDSFTYSEPCNTFSEWLRQKRRHLSTGKLYKAKTKFLLGTEFLSRLVFYLSFALLIYYTKLWIPIFIIFGLRFLVQGIIIKLSMNRLKEKNLFLPSFFYDIIFMIIYITFYFTNSLTRRKNTWD